MTRATIQRAARELEERLGVPLFEATSHGLRPTREALRLALQVQLAVAELAQARAEVAATAGADTGQTVIGAMPLGRSFMVPEAVLRFAERRPQHRVSILDGPYENLLDALRRGRADVLVGALREQIPPDVVQEALFDDPLAIIVRRDHPLAKLSGGGRRAPPAAALGRFAWIVPRAGSPLRRHFERLFSGATAPPPAAPIECNSLIAARRLLLRSDRAMLLSAQQAHHELAAGELVALPHPAGRVVRAIGLTLRRDWQPTAAQAELLDMLREVAKAGLR
jgi:DNA-binding transcriptional LysR family regulator